MKLFPVRPHTMLEEQGATITMNTEPATSLILPWIDPSRFLHIKHTLEQHGATLTIQENAYHIAFPLGTIQKDLPQREEVPRQKIVFPDGWWLLYEHARESRLPQILVDLSQGEQPDA